MNKRKLNKKIVGTNIKLLRINSNLTKLELSNELNVSISTITSWESNKYIPSLKNIISICNFFNTSMDELLGLKK